jgi:hypothetical protein
LASTPGRIEVERMLENILLIDAVAKVEALPAGAIRRCVPLEDAIVLRGSACSKACACDVLLLS